MAKTKQMNIQTQDPSEQLLKALSALQNYFTHLFETYSFQLKITLMIILIYVFYKIGKQSFHEPIDNQVASLSKLLKNKQSLKQNLPKSRENFSKIKSLTKWLSLLTIIGLGVLTYLKKLVYVQYIWIGAISTILLVICIIIIWSIIIKRRETSLKQSDGKSSLQMKALLQMLGPKVENSLQSYLCRQKLLKSKKPISTTCEKKQCKQLRTAYRRKYQAIKQFVQTVLHFDWCSVCKHRKSFDEMLKYQLPQYNPKESQEEQVKFRMQYLLKTMAQMLEWIKTAGPCNCSKLYWEQCTKQIGRYKIVQKETNQIIGRLDPNNKPTSAKSLSASK